MKKLFFCLSLCTLGLVFFSCSEELKRKLSFDNVSIPNGIEAIKAFSEQDKYDELVHNIDTSGKFTEVYSLDYEDNLANHSKVLAYLDKNDILQKLSLNEASNNGVLVNTNYYFAEGQLFFCRQTIANLTGSKFTNGEIITYFGSQNKIIYSASRNANSKEELVSKPFMICKKIPFDSKKAMEIINQSGPYETKILGTVNTENLQFLVVGTEGSEGQKSSIAFNKDFPVANEICSNISAYKGQNLMVNFEVNEDNPQFKYQVLTGIKIAP